MQNVGFRLTAMRPATERS